MDYIGNSFIKIGKQVAEFSNKKNINVLCDKMYMRSLVYTFAGNLKLSINLESKYMIESNWGDDVGNCLVFNHGDVVYAIHKIQGIKFMILVKTHYSVTCDLIRCMRATQLNIIKVIRDIAKQ